MAFYNIFMAIIMMIGAMLGLILRIEHHNKPFNKYILILWFGVSIYGSIFYYHVELFLYMNMVTMGWMSYPLIT